MTSNKFHLLITKFNSQPYLYGQSHMQERQWHHYKPAQDDWGQFSVGINQQSTIAIYANLY